MIRSLKKIHWSIYLLAMGSGFLMTGFLLLIPVIPVYASQHNFSDYEIGLLIGSFMLGSLLFQFPAGVLSDHIGRKQVMVGSLLLFTISTLVYSLTTEPVPLIALRFLQGIASGAYFIGFQSYINDRTPMELRGLANGVNSSAINAGVVVGPLLGGFIYEAVNIQAPFVVAGLIGLVLIPVFLAIPRVEHQEQIRQWNELLLTLGKIKQVMAPVFTPSALSLSLVHFLQLVGMTIFLISASLIASEFLGWDAGDIALAFAVNGIAAVIASPFVGKLSDREGSRVLVMFLGLMAMSVQCLVFYFHPGAALIIIGFIIGGAGTPAYYNSFFAVIGDLTRINERGAVGGFIGSFGQFGSFVGGSFIGPFLWSVFTVDTTAGICFLLVAAAAMMAILTRSLMYRQVMRIQKSEQT